MIITEGKTLQEVSDEIAVKLNVQGQRCMDFGEGTCAYGNTKQQHCAIGWLLPEENTMLMQAEGGIKSIVRRHNNLGPNDAFIRDNIEAFEHIQSLHDAEYKERRETVRDQLIMNHGLDMSAWAPWINLGEV